MMDYGRCPECFEDMTEEHELHTWSDDLSDCHADCCPLCNNEQAD